MHEMSKQWKSHGLNITIWPDVSLPKAYNFTQKIRKGRNKHKDRQQDLVVSCTHHFMDRAKEEWLLLTDSDEFLSYNFIQPGENRSHFDQSYFWKSDDERAIMRSSAWPIRQLLPRFENDTILSFIQNQRDNTTQSYFPTESGCNRIVGLNYGVNTTETDDVNNEHDHDILMTKKYQKHSQDLGSGFSKVFLELPKISPNREQLGHVETIHNPFPRLCGRNGRSTSGK